MDSQQQASPPFTLYFVSEYAISMAFGNKISPDLLQQISRFDRLLHNRRFEGFRATVPAYTTLSVFFDPVEVSQSRHLKGNNCYERVSGYLEKLHNELADIPIPEPKTITIPVCYGGRFGPDLEEVANLHGMTTEAVISMHSGTTYDVHLIGFTPGFAYLGGMTSALETPRKSTPRKVVPSGSVGIAGKQTGIYPCESPGGWQLVGRTPICLFDASRTPAALLKSGDKVVFNIITPQQFESYGSDG